MKSLRSLFLKYAIPLGFVLAGAIYMGAYFSLVERNFMIRFKLDEDGLYQVPPYFPANLSKVFYPAHQLDRHIMRPAYWALTVDEMFKAQLAVDVEAAISHCQNKKAFVAFTILAVPPEKQDHELTINSSPGYEAFADWLTEHKEYLCTQPTDPEDVASGSILKILNRDWKGSGRYDRRCNIRFAMVNTPESLISLFETYGVREEDDDDSPTLDPAPTAPATP
jgi:hypothetical protein